ncbi:hypothetical protein UlMin_022043 [Ulmus minor]
MKRILCYILLALLGCASVTSMLFRTSENHFARQQQEKVPHRSETTFTSSQGVENSINEEEHRGLGRVGSIPPNCVHKCESCVPCYPVQIPTSTDHIGVLFANYEPEGWKCKCGSSFFNP